MAFHPPLSDGAFRLFHVKIYIIIHHFIEIFIFVNYLVVRASLRGRVYILSAARKPSLMAAIAFRGSLASPMV
jgi:hypothetical protein